MAEWVRSLVKGFKGGQAVIRFVSAGGILLGLDDLKEKLGADSRSGSVRAKTEDELIVALTEIMELYGAPKDSAWEKEFQPETEHGECKLHVLTFHRVPELTEASGCPFSLFGVCCPIPATCFLGTHKDLATLCGFHMTMCILYS